VLTIALLQLFEPRKLALDLALAVGTDVLLCLRLRRVAADMTTRINATGMVELIAQTSSGYQTATSGSTRPTLPRHHAAIEQVNIYELTLPPEGDRHEWYYGLDETAPSLNQNIHLTCEIIHRVPM